jgi:transposase
MGNPCIALDVSKGKCYFQGFIRMDKPFSTAKQIEHTKAGFDFMMATAENLKKEGDVTFIFESTGIYHKGLQKYVDEHEEKYIILNPLEAARLIAEIGDILRFSNKRQLVAYAGIDPRVYQSGQVSGEHLYITKKGNKQLRTLLYLAVSSSLRLKKLSVIREFYDKKRQQTNPLSHKAALIACANKLLRIIYGMNRNGFTFII